MALSINAQFSIETGVNLMGLNNYGLSILHPRYRSDFSELTASFSIRYQKKNFLIYAGNYHFFHFFDLAPIETLKSGDPYSFRMRSIYLGCNLEIYRKKTFSASMGLVYSFDNELTKTSIFLTPFSTVHPYIISSEVDMVNRVGLNAEVQYSPNEFIVIRLKSTFVLPSKKKTVQIKTNPSYSIYQLSYGIYL